MSLLHLYQCWCQYTFDVDTFGVSLLLVGIDGILHALCNLSNLSICYLYFLSTPCYAIHQIRYTKFDHHKQYIHKLCILEGPHLYKVVEGRHLKRGRLALADLQYRNYFHVQFGTIHKQCQKLSKNIKKILLVS